MRDACTTTSWGITARNKGTEDVFYITPFRNDLKKFGWDSKYILEINKAAQNLKFSQNS
jgi:hypothetical protein